MGTPAFAVPSLRTLVEAGNDVVAVVTRPDKPSGRGLDPKKSEVKVAALALGIEVIEPLKLKDPALIERLASLAPDICAVVAYGRILPAQLLKIAPRGCVNLHASLLPAYRGAAPINRAVINGDRETGVTTMLMDEGLDTGPMLLKVKVRIEENDTAGTLFEKLSVVGAPLLAKTIELLMQGAITPVAQDDSKATYAPILKKEDGLIDWRNDAVAIGNLVRGLSPWPGAHTMHKGKILKIHSGNIALGIDANGEPGTMHGSNKEAILVNCAKSVFSITLLQPEGKRAMSAKDFLMGYRLGRDERLG